MRNLIFITVFILTQTFFVNAAVVKVVAEKSSQNASSSEESAPKYLGRLITSKLKASSAGNNHSHSTSDYYILDESDDWYTAVDLCNRQVPGSSLVAIESEEEIKELNAILDPHGANAYWTSGRFSFPPNGLNDWVWNVNGLGEYPLPPNRPWASKHPKGPFDVHRVLLNYQFNGNHFWSTAQASERHLIVCELAAIDSAIPCYKPTDLSIVLDSSGSIGQPNYDLAKTFVAKLSRAFTTFGGSRFNLMIYSTGAYNAVPLNSGMTADEIETVILSAMYYGEGTETHLGINDAMTELLGNGNLEVAKSMVVLTDGASNSPTDTVLAAEAAAAAGIRMFAVGIGNETIQNELLAIAGYKEENVYTLPTFDDLIKVLVPMSVIICPNHNN